jgi:O-antigen/teichoic acid export membrane protein
MYNFGYKLLFQSLLNTLFRNLSYFIIGKFYSTIELGYFSRAQQFQSIVSKQFYNAIQKVSLASLATLSETPEILHDIFNKFQKISLYLNIFFMISLFMISKPLILLLIGAKWAPSIVLLQLLCIEGIIQPLNALFVNLFIVYGRSDIILKVELYKKSIDLPVLIIMSFISLKFLIIGMILTSLFGYILSLIICKKYFNFNIKKVIIELLPTLFIGFLTFIIIFSINQYLVLKDYILIILNLIMITSLYLSFSIIFKVKEYYYLIKIFKGLNNSSNLIAGLKS